MKSGRPAIDRKTVQLLVILTLLAWATQTLLSQWGYGAEVSEAQGPQPAPVRFVPADAALRAAAVELRSTASVSGPDIRLRHVARWPHRDNEIMQQAGDLVVARFAAGATQMTIDLDAVRSALEAAGANAAAISFSGAIACKVTRNDPGPGVEEQDSRILPARRPAEARPGLAVSSVLPTEARIADTESGATGARTLREVLLGELSERLGMPVESLQVRFRQQDERFMVLREPLFSFSVEPDQQREIGTTKWEVTIGSAAGKQKVSIAADVRAWQTQVLAARPIAYKQVFGENDVIERRVLVDRLGEGMQLTKSQVVGQQAARDIEANTRLTSRMIETVQVVKMGELMTVLVQLGQVQVSWIAEARESGSVGQTIRVRKPNTWGEDFKVTVTGAQEARLIGPAATGSRLASAP